MCSVKTSLSLSVAYDYTTGGSTTSTKAEEFSKEINLSVPPYHSIRSKLMVEMAKDAEISFVATIKKTRGGRETRMTQRGTWKGVLMANSYVENADLNARSTAMSQGGEVALAVWVLVIVGSCAGVQGLVGI